MDDVWTKINQWKGRQRRFSKKGKFLYVLIDFPIWCISVKIKFIVKKIKFNSLIFHLKNSHILLTPCEFEIKMSDKLHLIPIFIRDRRIFGNHNPDIEFIFIKVFWQ